MIIYSLSITQMTKNMESNVSYGQFCPLAMASEFLCKRWTLLVLRELLLGSESFNDLSRGLGRMSRSLLSKRLKELEKRGLIHKQTSSNQRETKYTLTTSGKSLSSVVFGMADWGQEWLHIEPSLEDVDADHLFWSIRRTAKSHPDLPNPFVVNIFLSDQPKTHQNCWLIFEEGEVELCIRDNDYVVDVQLEVSARDLVKIYLGWSSFSEAVEKGELILRGAKQLTDLTTKWFGFSRLADINKQPVDLRVL